MDGLLNFDKPVGITSAKALYRIRKLTGQRKSGHAGTLDPAARGVLLIGLGKGTKLTERLMDLPKVYRATARLDVTSESFDSDRPLQQVEVKQIPARAALDAVAATFVGEIQQVPPAISAIKVDGQRAYKRQRAGEVLELKPRPVQVYDLSIEAYAWPDLTFSMTCGRGTYVRALIRDLGAALGAGGCLTSLCREAIGPFKREDAATFESLEADHERAEEVPHGVLSLDHVDRQLDDQRIVFNPNA